MLKAPDAQAAPVASIVAECTQPSAPVTCALALKLPPTVTVPVVVTDATSVISAPFQSNVLFKFSINACILAKPTLFDPIV